jgi:translation initiation factor IF-2
MPAVMSRRLIPVLLALTWAACCLQVRAEVADSRAPVQRAADDASVAARTSALYREVACRAAENALAAQHDAAAAVLTALKGGESKSIDSARKVLAAAEADAEEAVKMAQSVVRHAADADAAVASVAEAVKAAATVSGRSAAEEAAGKAQEEVRNAKRVLARARVIVEAMKLRWLIPAMASSPSAPREAGGADGESRKP